MKLTKRETSWTNTDVMTLDISSRVLVETNRFSYLNQIYFRTKDCFRILAEILR